MNLVNKKAPSKTGEHRITIETRRRREQGIHEAVLSESGRPILTSVWIPTREQLNEYKRVPFYKAITFTGRTFPHVVRKLLLLYSDKGDLVYDPMLGSGTTIYESKKLKRRVKGSDVNPDTVEDFIKRWKRFGKGKIPRVRQSDAADLDFLKDESVDLIIMSFPWFSSWNFGKSEDSMESHEVLDDFLEKSTDIYNECFRILRSGKFVCNIMGNTYRKGIYYPVTMELMSVIKEAGLQLWYQFWNLRCLPESIVEPWVRGGLDINNKKADNHVGWDMHEDIIIARKPE